MVSKSKKKCGGGSRKALKNPLLDVLKINEKMVQICLKIDKKSGFGGSWRLRGGSWGHLGLPEQLGSRKPIFWTPWASKLGPNLRPKILLYVKKLS